MNLKDHLELVGWTPEHLDWQAKLPAGIGKRAMNGKPIPFKYAEAICRAIGHAHGMRTTSGKIALLPEHIDGLSLVHPHELTGGQPAEQKGV